MDLLGLNFLGLTMLIPNHTKEDVEEIVVFFHFRAQSSTNVHHEIMIQIKCITERMNNLDVLCPVDVNPGDMLSFPTKGILIRIDNLKFFNFLFIVLKDGNVWAVELS